MALGRQMARPMTAPGGTLWAAAWVVVGTLAPVLYIWLLPVLSERQVIPLRRGYGEGTAAELRTKHQVSFFISTPAGTGAMAALFIVPIVMMWSPVASRSTITHAGARARAAFYASLVAFHVGFGAFLVLTVTWSKDAHTVAVALFSIAALAHFALMLRLDPKRGAVETAILLVGGAAFAAIVVLVLGLAISRDLEVPPYLFWALECTALSAMVLFTPAAVFLDGTARDALRNLRYSDRRLAELRAAFDRLGPDDGGAVALEAVRAVFDGGPVAASGAGGAADAARGAFLDDELPRYARGGRVGFSDFADLHAVFAREHSPLLPGLRLSGGGAGGGRSVGSSQSRV